MILWHDAHTILHLMSSLVYFPELCRHLHSHLPSVCVVLCSRELLDAATRGLPAADAALQRSGSLRRAVQPDCARKPFAAQEDSLMAMKLAQRVSNNYLGTLPP